MRGRQWQQALLLLARSHCKRRIDRRLQPGLPREWQMASYPEDLQACACQDATRMAEVDKRLSSVPGWWLSHVGDSAQLIDVLQVAPSCGRSLPRFWTIDVATDYPTISLEKHRGKPRPSRGQQTARILKSFGSLSMHGILAEYGAERTPNSKPTAV